MPQLNQTQLTFTKPPVQHIGHCVRHAMLEVPAPAPAALGEITKASFNRPTLQQPCCEVLCQPVYM